MKLWEDQSKLLSKARPKAESKARESLNVFNFFRLVSFLCFVGASFVLILTRSYKSSIATPMGKPFFIN